MDRGVIVRCIMVLRFQLFVILYFFRACKLCEINICTYINNCLTGFIVNYDYLVQRIAIPLPANTKLNQRRSTA